MSTWMLLLGCTVAVVCYAAGRRAGRICTEKKYLAYQVKENEKMDKILRRYAHAGRDELLNKLRHGEPK